MSRRLETKKRKSLEVRKSEKWILSVRKRGSEGIFRFLKALGRGKGDRKGKGGVVTLHNLLVRSLGNEGDEKKDS